MNTAVQVSYSAGAWEYIAVFPADAAAYDYVNRHQGAGGGTLRVIATTWRPPDDWFEGAEGALFKYSVEAQSYRGFNAHSPAAVIGNAPGS